MATRSVSKPNLFQRAAIGALAHIVGKSTGHKQAAQYIKEWVRGLDLLPNRGTSSIPASQEYSSSVWVYRCINVWQQLANIPLKLMADAPGGGTEEIKRGPVRFLLDNPNSKTSPRQFLERIVGHLGLYGHALITREDGTNFDGLPQFLHVMDPRRVRYDARDVDTYGNPTRWLVRRADGTEYPLDARGVICIKLPNPYNPAVGLSPVSALRASIDSDYAARLHNAHMMANHGRIGGMVTFDDPNLTTDQVKDYAKLWNESYAGPENAGKTAFFTKADYTAINQSMKDLDWLNGQYVAREEIFAGFNVPPIIAGDFRYGTYANYEQAAKELWVTCLMPLGGRIVDVLQKAIVDGNQKPAAKLVFDYANHVPALREDTASKIAQYTQLIREGFVSPAQAAEMVGLKLGEPNPAHDVVWTTFNLIPAIDSMQGDTVYTKPSSESTPNEATPPDTTKALRAVESHTGDMREQLRALKWRGLVQIRTPYERKLAEEVKAFFFAQRSAFLSNLETAISKRKSLAKDGVTVKAGWNPDDLINDVVGDKPTWDKRLAAATEATTEAAISAAAVDLLKDLGKPSSDYARLALVEYRAQRPVILAKVNETTYGRLTDAAKVLENSIASGASIDDAAEAMRVAIRSTLAASEGRRRIIARTEIGRAFESARVEQMQVSGVASKEWLSSRDSEVRDSHTHVDGEVVPVDQAFSNGLTYPGDVNGPPEETINCRCVSLPVLDK